MVSRLCYHHKISWKLFLYFLFSKKSSLNQCNHLVWHFRSVQVSITNSIFKPILDTSDFLFLLGSVLVKILFKKFIHFTYDVKYIDIKFFTIFSYDTFKNYWISLFHSQCWLVVFIFISLLGHYKFLNTFSKTNFWLLKCSVLFSSLFIPFSLIFPFFYLL